MRSRLRIVDTPEKQRILEAYAPAFGDEDRTNETTEIRVKGDEILFSNTLNKPLYLYGTDWCFKRAWDKAGMPCLVVPDREKENNPPSWYQNLDRLAYYRIVLVRGSEEETIESFYDRHKQGKPRIVEVDEIRIDLFNSFEVSSEPYDSIKTDFVTLAKEPPLVKETYYETPYFQNKEDLLDRGVFFTTKTKKPSEEEVYEILLNAYYTTHLYLDGKWDYFRNKIARITYEIVHGSKPNKLEYLKRLCELHLLPVMKSGDCYTLTVPKTEEKPEESPLGDGIPIINITKQVYCNPHIVYGDYVTIKYPYDFSNPIHPVVWYKNDKRQIIKLNSEEIEPSKAPHLKAWEIMVHNQGTSRHLSEISEYDEKGVNKVERIDCNYYLKHKGIAEPEKITYETSFAVAIDWEWGSDPESLVDEELRYDIPEDLTIYINDRLPFCAGEIVEYVTFPYLKRGLAWNRIVTANKKRTLLERSLFSFMANYLYEDINKEEKKLNDMVEYHFYGEFTEGLNFTIRKEERDYDIKIIDR